MMRHYFAALAVAALAGAPALAAGYLDGTVNSWASTGLVSNYNLQTPGTDVINNWDSGPPYTYQPNADGSTRVPAQILSYGAAVVNVSGVPTFFAYMQMAQPLSYFLGADTNAVSADGIINVPKSNSAGDIWPGWYIDVDSHTTGKALGGDPGFANWAGINPDVEIEWDIQHTDVGGACGFNVWGQGGNLGNSFPTGTGHPADDNAAIGYGGQHSPLAGSTTIFAVSMPVSQIASLALAADGAVAENWTQWRFGVRVQGETDMSYDNGGVMLGGANYIVAPYLAGDANRDGTVDGADLNVVLSNYNQTVAGGGLGWTLGDFNGDGVVDGADLNTVLSNYNQSQSLGTAVPEPSALLLAAVGLSVFGAYAGGKWKSGRK